MDGVEVVSTFGRANEHRPAITIGERRTKNLGPRAGIEVAILISYESVMISSAETIVGFCAIEADASAIRKAHHQIALALLNTGDAGGEALEIFPGHVFRLGVCWCEIGEASILAFAIQRCVDEVHCACNGLAAAAMDNETGPALLAGMERLELWARLVT